MRLVTLLFTATFAVAGAAEAGTVQIAGTRSNVSPGGAPGGRCGAAILVSFAPDNFSASGTSNLGDFSYTASHCITPPLPAPYVDGEFEWTFDNGTLFGTHAGALNGPIGQGLFSAVEDLVFTGGTGRYAGASGWASFVGTVQFGTLQDGTRISFGEGSFTGEVTAPGIPEPAAWGMLILGFGTVGVAARRRRLPQAA
jgi:hypothetical protein